MEIIDQVQPKSIHERIVDEYRKRYLAGDEFDDRDTMEIVACQIAEDLSND